MYHIVFSISFLSFTLMFVIYEIMSLILLSPRTRTFRKMVGRPTIVFLRAISFLVSLAVTLNVINFFVDSTNISLSNKIAIIGIPAILSAVLILLSHIIYSVYNDGAYSFMIISQKATPIDKK